MTTTRITQTMLCMARVRTSGGSPYRCLAHGVACAEDREDNDVVGSEEQPQNEQAEHELCQTVNEIKIALVSRSRSPAMDRVVQDLGHSHVHKVRQHTPQSLLGRVIYVLNLRCGIKAAVLDVERRQREHTQNALNAVIKADEKRVRRRQTPPCPGPPQTRTTQDSFSVA